MSVNAFQDERRLLSPQRSASLHQALAILRQLYSLRPAIMLDRHFVDQLRRFQLCEQLRDCRRRDGEGLSNLRGCAGRPPQQPDNPHLGNRKLRKRFVLTTREERPDSLGQEFFKNLCLPLWIFGHGPTPGSRLPDFTAVSAATPSMVGSTNFAAERSRSVFLSFLPRSSNML